MYERKPLPAPNNGKEFTKEEVDAIMEGPLFKNLTGAILTRAINHVQRGRTVSKAVEMAIKEESDFQLFMAQGYGQTFEENKKRTLENVYRRLNS